MPKPKPPWAGLLVCPALLLAMGASICPIKLWTFYVTGESYDPFSGFWTSSPRISLCLSAGALVFAAAGAIAGYRKPAALATLWAVAAPTAAYLALQFVRIAPDG